MDKRILNKIKYISRRIVLSSLDMTMYYLYKIQFKKLLKRNNIPNQKAQGEDDYLKKWGAFNHKVEPYSYRLFSHYCGGTADIVPENIGRRFIEPILNPPQYKHFYGDKNAYDMYLDVNCLPKTYIKRSAGGYLQFLCESDRSCDDMHIPNNVSRLILKPSAETSSGSGVMLFTRNEKEEWICEKSNQYLSVPFLMGYGADFVLQEAVNQHPYISQFCYSAVNTLRISTYKSFKDDEVHVLGSIMRIGVNGNFVDNAHAGGLFVGINIDTGKVGETLYDQYGKAYDEFNGIKYTANEYVIPHWNDIIEFAKYIGHQNRHCRLLALDIALDVNGKAKLIEFNCKGFSYWLFMMTGSAPFGKFTDEIIEYCSFNKDARRESIIL